MARAELQQVVPATTGPTRRGGESSTPTNEPGNQRNTPSDGRTSWLGVLPEGTLAVAWRNMGFFLRSVVWDVSNDRHHDPRARPWAKQRCVSLWKRIETLKPRMP